MKMNVSIKKSTPITTHEGGKAIRGTAEMQLYRTTCAAMLGENTFYEGGESILNRIATLCTKANFDEVLAIAAHAKDAMKLRHVPLWMMLSILQHPAAKNPFNRTRIQAALVDLIQRPDELGEVIAMVWKGGKRPIPNTVRKALAKAFHKFNAYAFAKNDHNTASIRLRDVMFLVHPKPVTSDEAVLFKQIASNTLPTPDTWEVHISAAKSADEKRAVWERLLGENKLGALALLRNLRNMESVNVNRSLIRTALAKMDTTKVLPFRFAAAERNSTGYSALLDNAFIQSCAALPRLSGHTLVLVDHSGSMSSPLSAKSDMTMALAAQSLAAVLREVCEDITIHPYHTSLLPALTTERGLGIMKHFNDLRMGGTNTSECLNAATNGRAPYDRVIIITDEQSHSHSRLNALPETKFKYVLNVGSYTPSIAYGPWTCITGFSEQFVHFLASHEQETPAW